MAISWMRLHPEEMNDAKDEKNKRLAEEFQKSVGDRAGEVAVKIFNGFATDGEMEWENWADHWRSFNTEDYKIAFAKVVDEHATAFGELYPNFTPMEAAGIIDNDLIGKMVLDPEVKEEMETSPEAFMDAKCWGLRNVGLMRAASAQIDAKNAKKIINLWLELETLTEVWRKGSYMLTSIEAQENPDLDRFAGFRARLENKFAWVYGYLSKVHVDLFDEIETFDSRDPMGKVIHGIRPSTFIKYKKNIEESFLKHKKLTESNLADTIAKISTWNTYFGVKEIFEEEEAEGGEGGEGEGGPI